MVSDEDDLARGETENGPGGEGAADPRSLPRGIRPLLVLGKIRQILEVFGPERPELTFAEIRRATDLPASTCQRLVSNMVAEQFLDRHGDKYRVGLRLGYWAAPAGAGLDVSEIVHPALVRLRDTTGETACLYRREGDVRVCVAMAETYHAIRRQMYVGKLMPLHAGSASRVLLAWDEAAAEEVLGWPLEPFTTTTVTDPSVLRALLGQTRQQGYAITSEERDAGAASVSAPVFGPGQALVGALGISGPTQRLTSQRAAEWAPEVVRAAEQATRLLGGRPGV
ncbi:IclR family transcriptional regulator [Amycolatopsis cynarae]|uniref:IclR family transcriptional regulator n=1 Tax=Amycolatopsis cynarae TaxID=2995223 RepID=A0ABY7B6Q8_9PSEU|nr:IclR family transcriptional regulator [Amycolatopsis sp. HUAS 11-8]WAL67836.1 IclR family transcriptional regulator [Amycolatopsis sp. HUAS 11-8]